MFIKLGIVLFFIFLIYKKNLNILKTFFKQKMLISYLCYHYQKFKNYLNIY